MHQSIAIAEIHLPTITRSLMACMHGANTQQTRTEAYLARRSLFEDQNAAISGPYHSELLTSAEEALNDWLVACIDCRTTLPISPSQIRGSL